MGPVGGSSVVEFQVDFPDDFNRLWFVGQVVADHAHLRGEAPSPLLSLVARDVCRELPDQCLRRASEQWPLAWRAYRRQRILEALGRIPAGSATLSFPDDMADLRRVAAAVEDLFRAWWASPAGAKCGMAYLVDVLEQDGRVWKELHGTHAVSRLDVVGTGSAVERVAGYACVGAGLLFPPTRVAAAMSQTPSEATQDW